MPASLDLQREFEDHFQAILIERRHELDDVLRLGLERGWFGTSAIFTNGYPFEMNRQSVPSYILLSPEGTVVMEGNPLDDMDAVRSYLAEQRATTADRARDLARLMRLAEKAMASGAYARATQLCEVIERTGANSTLAAKAAALLQRTRAPELVAEITAEKALRDALAESAAGGTVDTARAALQKITNTHTGTRAARTAATILAATIQPPGR